MGARRDVDASRSRRRSRATGCSTSAPAIRPTRCGRSTRSGPGAAGDISLKPDQTSNDFIAWSQPTLGAYNPSALVYGDYYYTLLDRGFLTCHDAKTGKEIYARQRISADASGFTASPWAYNGKVFALSEDGDTFVMQAGPEFKVLGKNSLDEMTLATPAVANGSLIIRTASKLYRISEPRNDRVSSCVELGWSPLGEVGAGAVSGARTGPCLAGGAVGPRTGRSGAAVLNGTSQNRRAAEMVEDRERRLEARRCRPGRARRRSSGATASS